MALLLTLREKLNEIKTMKDRVIFIIGLVSCFVVIGIMHHYHTVEQLQQQKRIDDLQNIVFNQGTAIQLQNILISSSTNTMNEVLSMCKTLKGLNEYDKDRLLELLDLRERYINNQFEITNNFHHFSNQVMRTFSQNRLRIAQNSGALRAPLHAGTFRVVCVFRG